MTNFSKKEAVQKGHSPSVKFVRKFIEEGFPICSRDGCNQRSTDIIHFLDDRRVDHRYGALVRQPVRGTRKCRPSRRTPREL